MADCLDLSLHEPPSALLVSTLLTPTTLGACSCNTVVLLCDQGIQPIPTPLTLTLALTLTLILILNQSDRLYDEGSYERFARAGMS